MSNYLISVFIIWLNPQAGKMKQTLHSDFDWLATWAGKMEPSCLLRKPCVVPTSKSSLFCHVINRSSLFGQDSWILASQKRAWPISSHLDRMLVNNTYNYLEQWLNFLNIFSKKAFYIAFKGLCYAIFCSLRGLNVSWHKLNFRNNGPVLLFTALFTKMRTLKLKSRPHNWIFCCRQL